MANERRPRTTNEGDSDLPRWLQLSAGLIDEEDSVDTLAEEQPALRDQMLGRIIDGGQLRFTAFILALFSGFVLVRAYYFPADRASTCAVAMLIVASAAIIGSAVGLEIGSAPLLLGGTTAIMATGIGSWLLISGEQASGGKWLIFAGVLTLTCCLFEDVRHRLERLSNYLVPLWLFAIGCFSAWIGIFVLFDQALLLFDGIDRSSLITTSFLIAGVAFLYAPSLG